MKSTEQTPMWNGQLLMICSVCGYAATDETQFAEHRRESGHKNFMGFMSDISQKNRKGKTTGETTAEIKIKRSDPSDGKDNYREADE